MTLEGSLGSQLSQQSDATFPANLLPSLSHTADSSKKWYNSQQFSVAPSPMRVTVTTSSPTNFTTLPSFSPEYTLPEQTHRGASEGC